MEENNYFQKFVRFDIYCPKCKHANDSEVEDPCNECLNTPARTDGSRKPINFKEQE